MYEKWEFLLSEFRRLGGIADNVCQKQGNFGRGIFSINPYLRSRIYTPSKLMIKKEDICLEANKLRIMKDKNYSQEIRDFFNYYQDNFSWGGGGKESVESFEKGLRSFNPKLRGLIKKYLLNDLQQRHMGDWDQVILREFLAARAFKFKRSSMICPLLELVNHEVISLSFVTGSDGISTPNYPNIHGELTHNYNNKSSLQRFFYQGFFCKETIVFSLPFMINLRDLGIKFQCRGLDLDDDFMKIKRSDNIISIDGLPIADVNHSRLPNEYFHELINKIADIDFPENTLYRIFDLNISIRQNLLKESQSIDSEVANIFSEIINYEINLISSYD